MSSLRCNLFFMAACLLGLASCKDGIISGGILSPDVRHRDLRGIRDMLVSEDVNPNTDARVIDSKPTPKLDGYKADLGCSAGTTPCMGGCENFQTNFNHCGACGAACPTSTSTKCLAGKCSCGDSGKICTNGLYCVAGECKCVVVTGGCSGCCINNVCRNIGAPDPSNACRICLPSKSTSDYSAVPCVTTFAGTGTAGIVNGATASAQFNAPSGVALSSNGEEVYVVDQYNYLIRLIKAGQISNIAGSGVDGWNNGTTTTASFSLPEQMALDTSGNLYIADRYNYMIRLVAGGNVTTFAGTGEIGFLDGTNAAAKFNEPRGLAFNAQGNLLVADAKNNRLRLIANGNVTTLAGTGTSGLVNGAADVAQFKGPTGVAISGNKIYVADCENHAIRQLQLDGSNIWQVTTLAGSGQAGTADGTGSAARFFFPTQIVADAAGNLYVADSYNHKIRMVTSSGKVTSYAGSGSEGFADGAYNNAQFKYPTGLAIDSSGKIYVADQQNHRIRLITP